MSAIRILLLGPQWRNEPIQSFLRQHDYTCDLETGYPSIELASKYTHLITSGFHLKIKSEILDLFQPLNRLNIHATYLPFGKGIGTVLFALLFPIPLGSSIHILAPDLDTGDILIQEPLLIPSHVHSQRQLHAYWVLHATNLFLDNFRSLLDGELNPVPQNQSFTAPYISRSKSELFLSLLSSAWDSPISECHELSLHLALRSANRCL